jgi:hypothetical protein
MIYCNEIAQSDLGLPKESVPDYTKVDLTYERFELWSKFANMKTRKAKLSINEVLQHQRQKLVVKLIPENEENLSSKRFQLTH